MIRKTLHAIREMIYGLTSKDSFTQNFAITLSGNVVAQLIGFLFTPVIARIYGPEAYGLFALFIGMAGALAPYTTFQLPAGFPLIKEEQDFLLLLRNTILWLLVFVTLVLGAVAWGGAFVSESFHMPALQPLLFLLPLHLLFTGLDEILLGWSIRRAEFRRSAIGRTLAVVAGKLTTVALGIFLGPRAVGIIAGNLLQYPIDSIGKLSKAIRSSLPGLFPLPSFRGLLAVLRQYSSYPYFVATGVALSNLGSQMPVYLLSALHGGTSAGLFAMANSLVLMPLNLVINSSTAVFLQKSSQVVHSNVSALGSLATKLHNRLFWLGSLALLAFALVSDTLVAWLLGEPWREAGKIAGILAAGSLLTTSSFTLSVLYRQFNRERTNFLLQMVSLFLKTVTLFVAIRGEELLPAIAAFAGLTTLTSAFNLSTIFKMVKEDRRQLLVQTILSIAALTGIFILKT